MLGYLSISLYAIFSRPTSTPSRTLEQFFPAGWFQWTFLNLQQESSFGVPDSKIYQANFLYLDYQFLRCKSRAVTVTFSNRDIIGKGDNEFWAAGWKLTQTESGEMKWEVVPGERITGEEWAKDHLPHFQESEYATRRAYIDEIWEKYNIRKLFPDNLDKVTPGGDLVQTLREIYSTGKFIILYPIPQEPYDSLSDLAKSDATDKPQKSSAVLWENGWTYNEMGKDDNGNEWGAIAFPVSVVEPKKAIKDGVPEIFTAFAWEDAESYLDYKGNRTETPVSISEYFDRMLQQRYNIWLTLYLSDIKTTNWSGSERMARWFVEKQKHALEVINTLPRTEYKKLQEDSTSINVLPDELKDTPFTTDYNSG